MGEKTYPINTTVFRVLYQERGFEDLQDFAEEVKVDLSTAEKWLEGTEPVNRFDFQNICDSLRVEPSLLLLSSNEIMVKAQHIRVMRFYVNELLGKNDAPKLGDVRLIFGDIQDAAEAATAEEEVKQADFTIFNPKKADTDRKSNDAKSDG